MENIEWLEPWGETEPNGFETELKREVKSGHPLYGIQVKAIARRFDCDDVLFALVKHSHALAVVHLTYSSSEFNSQWPQTRFFANLEDWIENCMKPDNQDYQCGSST